MSYSLFCSESYENLSRVSFLNKSEIRDKFYCKSKIMLLTSGDDHPTWIDVQTLPDLEVNELQLPSVFTQTGVECRVSSVGPRHPTWGTL